MRVLVCDGQAKQALAVVRDLAAAGYDVWLGSPSPWIAAACWSRCCARVRTPESDTDTFLPEVHRLVTVHKIDVVLPLKDVTTRVMAHGREHLHPARTCLAGSETIDLASHKGRIGAEAVAAGFAVPESVTCTADTPATGTLEKLGQPLVVKAARGSGVVRYVSSQAALDQLLAEWLPRHGEVVVQEYIAGEGVGFFALYDHGRCVSWYTHRRLREYPATGGISVCAESTRDDDLAERGRALLDRLQWHGPAMVECKRETDTGRLVLLEVNTKFWGSLDLALACGLPFPRWAVQLAMGAPVEPPEAYPVGVRVHWPAPAALAQACTSWTALRNLIKDVGDPHVQSDWRGSDPLPHVVQLVQMAAVLWQTRGRWRAPHGRPVERAA